MPQLRAATSTAAPAAPAPGLRARKKAQLRERIIDTAVSLFRERGYEATRVDDIVGRLDISQPTFFRYFPSKDAVLREVGVRACDCMIDSLKTQRAREAGAEERLRQLYRGLARLAESDRPLWRAVVLADAMDAVRSPQFREPKQAWLDALTGMINDGQRSGAFDPGLRAADLAERLDALYCATVARWAVGLGGRASLQRRVDDVVEFFLRAARPAG